MKTIRSLFILFVITACCDDHFITPFYIGILKEGKPLSETEIYPKFTYLNGMGLEEVFPIDGLLSRGPTYSISNSEDQKKFSFEPVTLFIRYIGLPETDTIEFLMDYDCNDSRQCGCKAIVLKYMKCNSVLLDDFTIRK